jgi:hypothetical protein
MWGFCQLINGFINDGLVYIIHLLCLALFNDFFLPYSHILILILILVNDYFPSHIHTHLVCVIIDYYDWNGTLDFVGQLAVISHISHISFCSTLIRHFRNFRTQFCLCDQSSLQLLHSTHNISTGHDCVSM